MKHWCAVAVIAASVLAGLSRGVAPTLAPGDWPMWGGRADRNMVSSAKRLPTKWQEEDDPQLKWTAALGTMTYGNPVVAGGRVFIGTNNGQPRDASVDGDRGVLMCFAEKDGAFLWQAVHDKLETGNAEDWAEIGICSTPCVVGDRVYYVNNRAELVCCDAAGFTDGENDGPFADEERSGERDADFVWFVDLRKLGVTPFQASASSPLVVGDLVFVVTGHGVDETSHKVTNPDAPSFLAVNRNTGAIVWKDASPGAKILEGQWGSPAHAVVDGVAQVVFPGGDGWLYAFEPTTGKPLWRFDCKAHEPDDKKTRNQIVATPVFAGTRVLVAIGPNPEGGGGPGCLCAIDATKRGDITESGEAWRLTKDFGASISTVAVHDGLVFAAELDGFIGCVELATGKRVWRHDMLATVWGSPLVADGKLYVRNEDGDVVVMKAGREAKVLATNALPGLSHGTVVATDGVLYVAGVDKLYAIATRRADG